MNTHKFCFIICTNNDIYLEECIHYINHLLVPDGYEIDLITISDANSMTEGYNQGMTSSDAKYKIYMHQDVFILNKHLLFDLLNIFQSDSQIGMIGMVGCKRIPPTGMMWHEDRIGNLYTPNTDMMKLSTYRYSLTQDGYEYVSSIDGLFMATCRDLPWDAENLTGWDFYDVFQSMTFLLNGYKIVVPDQISPWCIHDDKKVLNLFNYDKYRLIFLEKYKDYLGKNYSDILKTK